MQEMDESLFEDVLPLFDEHLREENNHRVLFSGPFGVGKTTFINWYFGQNDLLNTAKYDSIVLSPIDYSIYSNEDIIKYIKYDLVYKLIEKFPESFKVNYISKLNATESYFLNNKFKLLTTLTLLIPQYGRQAHEFAKQMVEHKEELDALRQKTESFQKSASIFTQEVERLSGSVYENDEITQLIESVIEGASSSKEIVLIIDDIDRIDPTHIFRLFNVFSAHLRFDQKKGKSKFGFDKVIFVCDEMNIRKLYKNLYGIDVDYNGYIDKFYSKRIFYFNNKSRVELAIEKYVDNLKITSRELKVENILRDRLSYIFPFVKHFFLSLVRDNRIKLRTIAKWGRNEIYIPVRLLRISSSNSIQNHATELLVMFDILLSLFGSLSKLEEGIEFLVSNYTNQGYDTEEIVRDCIMILESPKHKFERGVVFDHVTFKQQSTVQYQIQHHSKGVTIHSVKDSGKLDANVFMYLSGVLKLMMKNGYY